VDGQGSDLGAHQRAVRGSDPDRRTMTDGSVREPQCRLRRDRSALDAPLVLMRASKGTSFSVSVYCVAPSKKTSERYRTRAPCPACRPWHGSR
jgi:hypothetical protein